MTRVTIIDSNGLRHEIEARDGSTLMEVAVANAIAGIDAECGGACSCGTCHVLLDDESFARLRVRSATESEILQASGRCRSNSRLACQMRISPLLDGLQAQVAPANQD